MVVPFGTPSVIILNIPLGILLRVQNNPRIFIGMAEENVEGINEGIPKIRGVSKEFAKKNRITISENVRI